MYSIEAFFFLNMNLHCKCTLLMDKKKVFYRDWTLSTKMFWYFLIVYLNVNTTALTAPWSNFMAIIHVTVSNHLPYQPIILVSYRLSPIYTYRIGLFSKIDRIQSR